MSQSGSGNQPGWGPPSGPGGGQQAGPGGGSPAHQGFGPPPGPSGPPQRGPGGPPPQGPGGPQSQGPGGPQSQGPGGPPPQGPSGPGTTAFSPPQTGPSGGPGGPGGPPTTAFPPSQGSSKSGGGLLSTPTNMIAAAITAAFVLTVLGDLSGMLQKRSTVFQNENGGFVAQVIGIKGNYLTGRDRILQLFNFGSVEWAIALLVATVLLLLGPRLLGKLGPEAAPGPLAKVLAGSSALVALGALVDVVVYFSYFGRSISLGGRGVLVSLAAVVIAGATAWWAFSAGRSKPQAQAQAQGAGGPAWGPGSQAPTTGFQAPPPGGYGPPGGFQQR